MPETVRPAAQPRSSSDHDGDHDGHCVAAAAEHNARWLAGARSWQRGEGARSAWRAFDGSCAASAPCLLVAVRSQPEDEPARPLIFELPSVLLHVHKGRSAERV